MKKLVAAMSLIMALSAGVTAFAADVTYESTDNQVTSDLAANYQTVLVTKAVAEGTELTAEDIVYMDQASSGSAFNAETQFLLKADPAPGEYVISFGGGNEETSKTFYIGVGFAGDVKMTQAGDAEEVNGAYNIGYKAVVPIGVYKSVLVETAEKIILGTALPTEMTGTGDVELAVQINGVENVHDISAVYLSTRAISNDTVEVQ